MRRFEMRGFTLMGILGLMLGLGACGKRGEPMRPSEVQASFSADISAQ